MDDSVKICHKGENIHNLGEREDERIIQTTDNDITFLSNAQRCRIMSSSTMLSHQHQSPENFEKNYIDIKNILPFKIIKRKKQLKFLINRLQPLLNLRTGYVHMLIVVYITYKRYLRNFNCVYMIYLLKKQGTISLKQIVLTKKQ